MYIHCPPKELPVLKSVTAPNGKRYYATPEGHQFPSVTTVVGLQKKPIIDAWRKRVGEEKANAISGKASRRGTKIHAMCEDTLKNKPLDIIPDANYEMFLSLKPELKKINNIQYQEQSLWSKQLGLAGTVDCIAEYDGKLSVIDFKTSKRIKSLEDIQDYFWQTCAYALMYEELIGTPINNLAIIIAVDDQKPIVFQEKTEDHIEGLLKAVEFYTNSLTKDK
jgi:genome maintenance exonuclease 1